MLLIQSRDGDKNTKHTFRQTVYVTVTRVYCAMHMESKDTHRSPLGHGPVAFAGWTGAVFDVCRFGHRVTRSGLIGAADITGHLGFTATFSRTLERDRIMMKV